MSINSGNERTILGFIKVFPAKPPYRWLGEIIFTVIAIIRKVNYIPCTIAVDPLNVLQAYILKKIKKTKIIYFHCVDYSKNRFNNKLLNYIYNEIYNLALNKSDICGVVSRKMFREFRGITKDKTKLFFIPNSPVYQEKQIDFEKRDRYSLVIMSGRVDDKTDYKKIVHVLARLKDKYPLINFRIIAKIEDVYAESLKQYMRTCGVEDRVSFLGFFADPKDLEKILINCGIGITSYAADKVGFFMKYADSLKIREFANYGLPIVADGICDTSLEAQENNCGFVADTETDMEGAIRKLWDDDKLYMEYSRNALYWARMNDKSKIMRDLYERICKR